MPTPRQIRAAETIVASSSIAEGLIKAGYSKRTARHPSQITQAKGFKKASEPIIKQLEKKRQMAIDALIGEKIDKEKASDVARIIDILTKNIELLSGRATGRVDLPLTSILNELDGRTSSIGDKKKTGGSKVETQQFVLDN